jgi:pyruvate formate lyase activating enzyme
MIEQKITRREFLLGACRIGIGLATAPFAFQVLELLAQDEKWGKHWIEVPRKYYKQLSESRTQCFICPLNCILKPGETCFCRTRTNYKGRLICHAYNNPCIVIPDDPIEKLPLNHFMPGENTLALGTGGCNLRCLYCQNWKYSQAKPHDLETINLPKQKAVKHALKKKVRIMAYTFTEPVVFLEYMVEIAELAKKKGMKNVCATAGFINKRALKDLCKLIDGFAVALKAFNEKFYEKVCGQSLKPILKALETIKSQRRWLEVVYLVVPTYNDDLKEIEKMCKWYRKNLGSDTPLHFGRFVPEYKLKDLPRTPQQTLEKCRDIGLDAGIKYVYIFNLSPHEGNNTFCPKCKTPVIQRLGFKILTNNMKNGRCGKCRKKIPGIWK